VVDRVRVVIADEHPVLRSVLRLACESSLSLELVGEAGDLEGLISVCATTDPQVVVMDLDISEARGVGALRALRESGYKAAVLILTDRTGGPVILEALRLGARGFLEKAEGIRKVASAVRRIADGERLVDPALEQAAVMELGRFARQAREGSEVAASLTPREREILDHLSTGLTMRQMANRLGISSRTVETHVLKLYRKLGVKTRVQAVARAASLGLIDLGLHRPASPSDR
jgi:NarL family two-component system response regulator YdfI